MKQLLFYFVLFCCISGCAQQNGVYNISNQQIDKNKVRETFLQPFIDSLNNYKVGNELPFFLNIVDFDTKNAGYWDNFHSPISLRKQIFDNVENQIVLEQIINSDNKHYKKIYRIEKANNNAFSDNSIPFSKYSIKEIAQFRLDEIQK